jgi:hypothetical protein
MPAAIPYFISMEPGGCHAIRLYRPLAAHGHLPSVSMFRMEMIIHVAPETARSAESRPCPHKPTTVKPLRTVISRGRAQIRGCIEVTIRTNRRWTDIQSHPDPAITAAQKQAGQNSQ